MFLLADSTKSLPEWIDNNHISRACFTITLTNTYKIVFKEQRMLQAVSSGLSNVFKSSEIVKSFKLMEQK